jgi:hypothetical protein
MRFIEIEDKRISVYSVFGIFKKEIFFKDVISYQKVYVKTILKSEFTTINLMGVTPNFKEAIQILDQKFVEMIIHRKDIERFENLKTHIFTVKLMAYFMIFTTLLIIGIHLVNPAKDINFTILGIFYFPMILISIYKFFKYYSTYKKAKEEVKYNDKIHSMNF